MNSMLASFTCACALTIHVGAAKQPNVVFILADDLGVNDLSLYGSTFYETPHIDALAKRGMTFTQAYSASPLCSPTRSSILTGLYPARTGITAPACHLPNEVLEKRLVTSAPPKQKALGAESVTRLATRYYTLAEAFKTNGYVTAHFGKWHLGPEPFSPLQQGFDIDIPHTPAPSPLGKGFFYPFPVWKGHGKPGDNLEDLVADEAVAFIAQHKDKPFFLNYWAFEVHSPWQAKEKQIDKYRAKVDPKSLQRNPVYAGMIETLDEVVGRLVAALDKAGVLDNTIIIFTSDNGPYFIPNQEHMPAEFHQVPVTSAQPLRAGKGTLYEAGTRIPLVVVWPGKVKPGEQSNALVQSVDFFPTFAEMLGWKLPDEVRFDGISLSPVFKKNMYVRDEILCHFPHTQAGGEYERMPAPTPLAPASSVRQGGWKLIRLYCANADQTDRFELYNLDDDPGERNDLAATQPERVKKLAARLELFLKETSAVIPVKNPAYDPNAKPPKAKEGNPILPGKGVADPHVLIDGERAYLYAGHDFSPTNKGFVMKEWWVWSSTDLVNWKQEGTLKPEDTFLKRPSNECWAGFGTRKNEKYYWYFSAGPTEIGVVTADAPAGPWKDPLGKPLVPKGLTQTEARDPDILIDDDGKAYMVFGTFDHYIVRLNEDMVSLAETPRLLVLDQKFGPYGEGKTDDKPSLHKRNNIYYLSWSSFYAMSTNVYGPYTYKGSVIAPERVASEFQIDTGVRKYDLWHDRHGNFFTWHNQWFYIVNDKSLPGRHTAFRETCISYVHYRDNGEIDPVRLDRTGVGQYDATQPRIEAEDFFKAEHVEVRESPAGGFEVRGLNTSSRLVYPNVRNLPEHATLTCRAASGHATGGTIEVRENTADGRLLGTCTVPNTGGWNSYQNFSCTLKSEAGTKSLCLVFQGGAGELMRLDWLRFARKAQNTL